MTEDSRKGERREEVEEDSTLNDHPLLVTRSGTDRRVQADSKDDPITRFVKRQKAKMARTIRGLREGN